MAENKIEIVSLFQKFCGEILILSALFFLVDNLIIFLFLSKNIFSPVYSPLKSRNTNLLLFITDKFL